MVVLGMLLLAADDETARVIKNCMRNRGYAVLN
jgi:hypothetical protein